MPQTNVLRLYTLLDTAPPYTSISQKFLELCPENHSHFTHSSPLWKNEQFFIHLLSNLMKMSIPQKLHIPGCLHPISLSPSKNALNCFSKASQNLLLQIGLVKPSMLKNNLNQFMVKRDQLLITSHLILFLKMISFPFQTSRPCLSIFKGLVSSLSSI